MNNELVDFSYLQELSGNDSVYLAEVVRLFLGTVPDGMRKLSSLVRETEDYDAMYKQAHFLKSSVSIIRVKDMFANLDNLEMMAKSRASKDELLLVLELLENTYAAAHPQIVQMSEAG